MNEEKEELTIFAVNRNICQDIELLTDMRSLEGYQLLEHIVLEQADLKMCNVAGKEKVRPVSTKQSQMKGKTR